jgi:hypothetical protein
MNHIYRIAMATGFALILAIGASATSEAVDVPAHQWNICSNPSNVCWAEAGPNRLSQLQKADTALYLIRSASPRPWLVTLEEVCSNTYERVRDALVPLGYLPDRVITDTGIASCGSYGSAMFTLGGVGSWDRQELGEGRAIGCRIKTTYLGRMKFCVAHPISSTQVAEAAKFYYSSANGMAHDQRMLGADLNKTPSDLGMFYAYNDELDYRNPPGNTHNTQRLSPKWKIDYLFTSLHSWRSPSRVCDPTWSDHCYFFGTFSQ